MQVPKKKMCKRQLPRPSSCEDDEGCIVQSPTTLEWKTVEAFSTPVPMVLQFMHMIIIV